MLLVDDNPVDIALLSRWLTEEDRYRVLIARDGAAAWGILNSGEKVSLVLSDKVWGCHSLKAGLGRAGAH